MNIVLKILKWSQGFFMFFEHWGMRISAWYMTNAYAALVLRSTISKEIIKEFNKHKDIKNCLSIAKFIFRKFKSKSF